MKIFVLEDNPERIVELALHLLNPLDNEVHWAATCWQEDRFRPPYDLILLDHDLGGRQLEKHEDNGLEFVRLILNDLNPDADIIIHSHNEEGSKNIRALIASWDHVNDTTRGLLLLAPFGEPLFYTAITAAIG
jgi:CheY-like chemotaxis protein